MALRKVTFFDHRGTAIEPIEEDGQAKPCVFGVRWLNHDTLETIRARGGKRTGPNCEVLREVAPTRDLSPFDRGRGPFEIEGLGKEPADHGK